jgi:hypothetical protein
LVAALYFRLSSFLALLCLVAAAQPALAQGSASERAAASERQVKAAFLYRFTEYVQWPDEAFARKDSPLVIGLVADEGVAAELSAVAAGRLVRGHPVQVRTLKEGEPLAGLHVLFIGEGANARLPQLIRAATGPVLVVTEAEEALARGSIINFVVNERRVRFEIALAPAAARSLTLGAGLLSVALNVRKDSRMPEFVHFAALGGLPVGPTLPELAPDRRSFQKKII